MFGGVLEESILKRAQESDQLSVALHDVRAYATDKHHVTDDAPYGGGGGMVMKPEPLFAAVKSVMGEVDAPIILLTPQGRLFDQAVAWELSRYGRIGLICGLGFGIYEISPMFYTTTTPGGKKEQVYGLQMRIPLQ